MTGTYEKILTPASVENVEETLQCIYEANSVAHLLTCLDEAEEFGAEYLTEIGRTIMRLLSQPMECAGQVIRDTQAAAKKNG
ncbi:MAG: hypothetical protein IIB68_08730 [Proteobacteria bacterium]|nr:hypothetical protein [Pseudomonadota bacterium]